jgi:hypothetical protein
MRHAACSCMADMSRASAWMFRATVIVSLGGLLACDASTAGVSPEADASADVSTDALLPDAALADAALADGAAACPLQQPSGACSGSPSCSYGCTSCECGSDGTWFCTGPSCPATCLGVTPTEGDLCVSAGACCPGIAVGDTCPVTCNGGTGSATCEAAQDASVATWHRSSPCPATLDGGGDGAPE